MVKFIALAVCFLTGTVFGVPNYDLSSKIAVDENESIKLSTFLQSYISDNKPDFTLGQTIPIGQNFNLGEKLHVKDIHDYLIDQLIMENEELDRLMAQSRSAVQRDRQTKGKISRQIKYQKRLISELISETDVLAKYISSRVQ